MKSPMLSAGVARHVLSPAALLLAALVPGSLPSGVGGQETGTVTGIVLEANTRMPLAGATVRALETSISATTDESGLFVLDGLRSGPAHLRLRLEGFASAVEEVVVWPGRTVEVRLEMAPLAGVLDALTVWIKDRRPSPEPEAVESPTKGDESASSALDRLPGVDISRGSGQVGLTPHILIRGLRTFVLDTEPVVILDGIRVSGPGTSAPGVPGGSALSILDHLDPETIERIEVIRGASGSVEYGPGSANGVIVIHTRKGKLPR